MSVALSTATRPAFDIVPAGAVRRTRLRLTARGRRGLAALAALAVAALLVLGALGAGAAMASTSGSVLPSEASASTAFETVTVQAGESLWSIAASVAPGADPRDVIDEIVRLNALDSVVVDAGQKLAIPADIRP